ncbi:MAG TPA: hypothetical protein VFJ93_12205 [Gaiellaceae bacterium]|nr:hypothetical protein [Gaiellaceae bacterium]
MCIDDAGLRTHDAGIRAGKDDDALRRRRAHGEAADGGRLLRIGNGRALNRRVGRGRRRALLGRG